MNLTIGLWKEDLGWTQLLTQIGVSWCVVRNIHAVTPDALSVVIVNTEPDEADARELRAYCEEGGALLGDFGRLRTVLRARTSGRRFVSLEPSAFGPFAPSTIVDIDTRGRFLSGSTVQSASAAGAASVIQTSTLGRGVTASIPFDVSSLIRSREFTRRNFYTPSERMPSEYVATISKGALREVITHMLEFLHHARSLPFVHTWYYPEGYPSIFTFRVDTDKGSREELTELHNVCVRHGVKGSWFADVKSHEAWLDFFRQFNMQEIGLHCYEHRTDSDREAVRANFTKGFDLLRSAGFNVCGATAPCGTWNESVDSVYEELQLSYSSEFSLAYDDLPFYPIRPTHGGGLNSIGLSRVLQLPIHPVCVGSMRRSALSSEQMIDYYERWIDNRMRAREPVCLYHHPTHHHWEVFDKIFSTIASIGIPSMTYADYAAWWRYRTASVPEIDYDGGTVRVTRGTSPQTGHGPQLWYRIQLPDKREIITPIDGAFDATKAQSTAPPMPAEIPQDVLRARAFDPRHGLLNFLDYWYKIKS